MSKSQLQLDRDAIMTEIRDIAAKAEAEQGGEFTDDQREIITDRMAKAKALQLQITAAQTSAALAEDVKSFLGEAEAEAVNADATKGATPGFGRRRVKSIGEYFTDSEQFKSAMAKHGGRVGESTHFAMDSKAELKGGLKALIGSGGDDGVGNLYDPQRLPLQVLSNPPLAMRNVVTVGETDSDAIVYARVLRTGAGGSTNNAAGVPEATTAAAVGSGNPQVTPVQAGVKPESALRFEKKTTPVITIANWVPATKRALSDAGQLRTLIDNFLRRNLEEELERQMLVGDSTEGEEFDGILNTDGIQVQAFDTNILVSVRRALTKVRRFGRANGLLVSPGTAERLDLLRDADGRYLGASAFGTTANTSVWRTPVIEVQGLEDDTVLVGDFSTAVVWDREDATITATDSHADFFVRNLVAILAEARAAFGVLDPALICKVDVSGDDVIVPAAA